MYPDFLWEPPVPTRLDYRLSADLPWQIGPCIKPGDFCYFVGADGEGKSTLIADILIGYFGWASGYLEHCHCLAGAWPLNPDAIDHERRCLIINAETSSSRDWAHRLMAMAHTHGYHPNDAKDRGIRSWFDFIDAEQLILRRPHLTEDCQSLARWIIGAGYQLVVLDPIYGVFRPAEGPGDDHWVNHGLKPLVVALKAAGITTFGIAHNNLTAQRSKRNANQSKYRPHGSGQQNGVMDCRFGIFRPDDEPLSTRLVKLKDRRAGWIPPGKAQIHFTYAKPFGFHAYEYRGSKWEIHDPEPFSLKPEVIDLIRALPATPTFTRREADALGLADKLDRYRDLYLIAQEIVTTHIDTSTRGHPMIFTWTTAGLRYRQHLEGN